MQEMRSRTLFYTSLGRLLMVELGEDEEKFTQFMIPITSKFIVLLAETLRKHHFLLNLYMHFLAHGI